MYQAFTRVPFYIPRFWFSNSTICTIALSNTQRLNERHFYVSMNRFNIDELFVENCGLSDDLWKLLNQNFYTFITSLFIFLRIESEVTKYITIDPSYQILNSIFFF